MIEPPRVALLIETSVIYGRKILAGVAKYLNAHRPWTVFLEQHELGSRPPAWLFSGKWDGVLSRPTDPELARLFRKMRVPVVDMNDLHDDLGLPWVGSDHEKIGRLGGEHLWERGFRHFAFAGFSGELWSQKRQRGFRQVAEAAGHSVSCYNSPWRGARAPQWDQDSEKIMTWLKQLPKPLGVMACNDARGLQILNACSRLGALVPDEIAVVGVDNDEILCELSSPRLSSVQPDPEQIGYAAAELLDAMMAGRRAAAGRIDVEPIRVVARRSTEALAVDDQIVATAMRFIRERATTGCKVAEVIRHTRVSRSALERRFRRSLQRSPQAEIHLVQMNRIKYLLVETDLTLEQIAADCGFEHPEYLSVMFKRLAGVTPGQYRRQYGRSRHRVSPSRRPDA